MADEHEFAELIQHAREQVGFRKKKTIKDVDGERFDNRMGSLSGLLTRFGASKDDLDDVRRSQKENKRIIDGILSNISINIGLNAKSFDILSPSYFAKLKEGGATDEEIVKVAVVEEFLESKKKELSSADILRIAVDLNSIGIEIEPSRLSNFAKKNLDDPDNINQLALEVGNIIVNDRALESLKKEIAAYASTCLNRLQVKWRKVSPLPIETQFSTLKKELSRTVSQMLREEESFANKKVSSFFIKKFAETAKASLDSLIKFYEMEQDLVYIKYLYALNNAHCPLKDFNDNIPESLINNLINLGVNINSNPKIQKIVEKGMELNEMKDLKMELEPQAYVRPNDKKEGKRVSKKISDAQNYLKTVNNTQKEALSKCKRGDVTELGNLYWIKKATLMS